jgi:hypothetical protein
MCNFILNGRWFFNIFLNRNRSWGSTIWIWEIIIFSSLPNFFILFYTIFVIDSKLFSHSSFWVLGLYRWEHLVNWFISMIIELSGHNELIQEAHESNLQISGFLESFTLCESNHALLFFWKVFCVSCVLRHY